MEIQKYLLPIFFIILFILGIYFIIFKKNKEYYENKIESNFSKHSENFENNKTIKDIINGYWTTMNTEVDGDKLKGILYKIVLNNENPIDGYVTTVRVDNLIQELEDKIPIIIVLPKLVVAEKSNNRIEFKINEEDKNPLKMENIPMAIVTTSYNSQSINSFKIKNPDITGGKLSRIIASKHFLNPHIQEKYDLNTYNKYLNYKYPEEPFRIEYNGIDEDKDPYKKLKNKYDNIIYLCYQREYKTVNNEIVRTPISKKYELSLVKDKKYFSKIILKNIEEENILNNILKPFILKNTYIYYYKNNKEEIEYIKDKNYLPQKFYSLYDLNFKNNFRKNLIGKPIQVIQIEDIEAIKKTNMDLKLLDKYIMTSNDAEITILPSDLEKII